jgi:hypothetical protein
MPDPLLRNDVLERRYQNTSGSVALQAVRTFPSAQSVLSVAVYTLSGAVYG